MVDAEDLGFLEVRPQRGIQAKGGFQIIADRFFDHDPGAFPVTSEPGFAEVFWNFAEHARRGGHVKDATGLGAPFLVQARAFSAEGRVSLRLRGIPLLVTDVFGKLAPLVGGCFPMSREFFNAVVEKGSQLCVA